MTIIMMLILNCLLSMIILTTSNYMASNTKNYNQKKYEFECGFNSISNSRIPFSYQFFLIAIMFLVFDLEISVMMPIATEESTSMIMTVNMNMLMLTLTAAMIMEWVTGMLEWTK
uniref:NADH dehydrogenase subunit 3 n=1 Tax=Halotydeus destructor TaxID=2874060 RepID=UPI002028D26F|nr:NADH dehydrogenase subunit 3 [Halotydeus destructor]UPN63257.1 NADH dehydrogenase subunit 3 [Halotydeus destructor]